MSWLGRTKKRFRVELLGPVSAGKTTLMYRLTKCPVPEAMVPTGVAVLEKHVDLANAKFAFCEQKEPGEGASAVIYLVDYRDLEAGLADLHEFVQESHQSTTPLLVLLNKQDLAETDRADVVAEDLVPIVGTERTWGVLACSALKNEGIDSVEKWLETTLKL